MGLLDIIPTEKEMREINNDLLEIDVGQENGVEEEFNDENSFEIVKKGRGGHSSFYVQRINPLDAHDELDDDDEKSNWVEIIKEWNLELASYVTSHWPQDQTALKRLVELGLVPEFVISTVGGKETRKNMSAKDKRRQKFKKFVL